MDIRKILLIIGGLLLLATAGVVIVFLNLPRVAASSSIRIVVTPEIIERGRYLTINVLQCVDCHSVRDWTRYGGPPVEPIGAGRPCLDRVTPAAGVNVGQEVFPGRLCIRNITSDMDTGIGKWTDGELIRAIREGVGRDGSGLFPIMPYFIYRDLSDEDVQAVVAFLRTLPPVRSSQPPSRELDFPLTLMVRLWPRPVEGKVIALDRKRDPLAYGRYLSRIARCEFCHSPREPRSLKPFEGRLYSGGMPFFLGNDRVMYPMNLTPHATGIGEWSREEFKSRFRLHGTARKVSPAENTLMNWNAFAGMTDADLELLYDFFKSLPPVEYQREPL